MPPGVNVVPGVDVAVCPLLSGSTVVTGRTERKQARPFGVVGIDSTRYKRCPRIRVAERIVRRVFVGRRNRDPARRIDARRHAYHTILRDAATEEVHTAARGLHDPRVRQRAYRREVDRRTILRRDDLAAQFGQQQLGIVFRPLFGRKLTPTPAASTTWPSVAVMLPPFVTFGAATSTNPPSLTVPFVCVTIDAPCSIVMSPGA